MTLKVTLVFGLFPLVVGNAVCLVLLCLISARRDKVCPLYRVWNWSDTNALQTPQKPYRPLEDMHMTFPYFFWAKIMRFCPRYAWNTGPHYHFAGVCLQYASLLDLYDLLLTSDAMSKSIWPLSWVGSVRLAMFQGYLACPKLSTHVIEVNLVVLTSDAMSCKSTWSILLLDLP